jgi:ABC-type polysaccharide/polyol phosphate export permease
MLDSTMILIRFSAYGAWIDIRNHFGRTRLGTLWNALGLTALIAALGLFFGTILKNELAGYAAYLPFLTAGVLVWAFLSASINQSCSVFGTRAQTLRHTAQPFAAIPISTVMRNLIIFLQNTVLAVIIYGVVFGSFPVHLPAFITGAVLVAANVLWISALAALACIRFRDLPQLIAGTLNVAFFLTPILWQEHFLGRYAILADINPAYHLISLVRLPLLGGAPTALSWMVGLAMLGIGSAVTVIAYAQARQKIPYWL